MFSRSPARETFVADTNFVSGTQKMFLILFRNTLCPQQMFPSLRSPRNIMGNIVSATKCPRLPGPLQTTLSMTERKPTNGLLTDRLNLTNNRRIESDQWLINNFTRVFQPTPSWLNWPITDQTYNTIDRLTLFTDCAQVVKTSAFNNSSFQNYPHPDDHTIRPTDTSGFKTFTMFQYLFTNFGLKIHWKHLKFQ